MSEPSIWKKEISFRRKPKEERVPAEPGAEQSTSIWKKEISFKRSPKPVPAPEGASPAEAAPPEKESIWKKEISFGRKAAAPVVAAASVEVAPEPPVAPEPAAVAPEPAAVAPEPPVVSEPVPPVAPEPAAVAPAPHAVASDPVVPTPDPVPVETPPVAEMPVPVAPEPQPQMAAPEPTAAVPPPVVEPEPTAVEPEPVPAAQPAAVAPEPVFVEPAPPLPSVEPAQEPVVVHPPVPASELPQPAPATKPVPFWKREIVIGRRGPAKQKHEQAPAPVPTVEPAAVPTPKAKSAPFWKRELALGRRGDKKQKDQPVQHDVPAAAATVAAAAAVPVAAAAAAKAVPFWKREVVIGRRGPKTDAASDQPAAEKKQKVAKPKRARAPKLKADRSPGKKLVGLKIGASQLAAARVTNNGVAELLQVARGPIGPGVIAGGELRDPDALAVALKDFFDKHKLPKRNVRLGIANNRIGVRTFDIAGIDDPKQLDNAIRFRAQDALPIPLDEAVLDYQVLGESTNENGERVRRILLVVAYREQIDRYVDACRKAGITLVGIDLEAFALLRALQAPQIGAGGDPDAALVAVAIGHERSTFAVSDGRVCEFTRVLEWGGAALNVAIARALDSAPSEAEAVKRSLSLENEVVPEGITSEQAVKARDAVRRAIQTFARELVSSLQFYQNQPGSLGIGEIVLTGGTGHLPGLAAELERLIGVHVRLGDPLARIKVSKRVGNPDQIGSLAVAIGLGIED